MNAVNTSILPALLLGVFGGLALLVAMFYSLRSAQIVIAVMLFLASISITVDYFDRLYYTWLLPIQAYRSQLFGLFGLVLLVGCIPRLKFLSARQISGHAWALMLIGLYAGLMRMYHVGGGDGLVSMLFVLATILPLALVLPAIISNEDGVQRVLRLIIWAALFWVAAVAVQFVINRRLIVLGANNRLTGLIGNCNQAATMLSVVAVCSLWLSLNGRRASRLFYASVTGLLVLLLIWTGSRGGAGMFVIGTAAVFYSRAGRAVLLLPVFAAIFFLIYKLAGAANIEINPERLTSLSNTRAAPWASLLASGLANPVVGAGPEGIEGSENSYLLGFASYGVGMLLLILAFVVVVVVQCTRLWWARRGASRDDAAVIDLVLGQQAMYMAGSIFEGYINSRVGSNLVIIIIMGAMGHYMLQRARDRAVQEYTDEVVYADDDGYATDPPDDAEFMGLRPSEA